MSMSPHTETTPARTTTAASAAVTSRRSFMRAATLGAAALGTAAATGVALTGTAVAATAVAETLVPSDASLVVFLQSLSLAAQQALATAADSTALTCTYRERLREFARHHRDQAARLGTHLPTETAAATVANPTLLSQMNSQLGSAGSQPAILLAAAGFEENLSATFITALGQTTSEAVAEAIAGCAPVLGQQAADLGQDAGQAQSTWMPAFAPTTGAYTPSAYPVR